MYKDCKKLPPFTPILRPPQLAHNQPPEVSVKTGAKAGTRRPTIGPVFSREEIEAIRTKNIHPNLVKHVLTSTKTTTIATTPKPGSAIS